MTLRVPANPRSRVIVLIALAVVLFIAACAYRYLTLGGRLGGLDNDEYVVLSYSQQLLMGDRPVRDYIEPGRPLQHWMLAGSQWAFGPTLLPPIALSIAMIALSTAVLFLLAERASGSILVALGVAVTQILLSPRFYNYPKVLAYAIGIPAIWWYMTRPGRGRLLAVAAAGVTAFLLRHDHGAYMALAGVVGVALAHWPDRRRAARAVAELGLMALALVAPYLVYVEAHSTLPSYVRASIEFGERSTAQTELHELPPFALNVRAPLVSWLPAPPPPEPHVNASWKPGTPDDVRTARELALGMILDNPVGHDTFNYKLGRWSKSDLRAILDEPLIASIEGINRDTLDTGPTRVSRRARVLDVLTRVRPLPGILNETNATAFLFYLLVLSPLIVLAAAALRRDAFDSNVFTGSAAKIGVVAVLSLAMMAGLLRGNLGARFADVSESGGIVVAAAIGLLIRRSSPSQRMLAGGFAVVLLLGAVYSVQLLEGVTLQIWRTGIDRGRQAVWTHARDVYRAYTAYPPVSAWDPREPGSVYLASYVERCTRRDDRLLVVGYMPELPFLSARAFANGTPWILPDFFITEDDQALMVARTRSHRVPVAVTVAEAEYDQDYLPEFTQVDAYLRSHYRQVSSDDSEGASARVFVARDLDPVRSDPITGFPCFAP